MKRYNYKIAGLLFVGVCLSGFLYLEMRFVSADPSKSDLEQLYSENILHIYGEGVRSPLNISNSAFFNETFLTFQDIPYVFLNRVNTTYNMTISGVSLANVLQTNGNLRENASYVQFVGVDGAKSFYLPLRIILADVQNVFIVTEENGGSPEDGPLKIAVFMNAIVNDTEMIQYFQENCVPGEDFVHNSKYAWKWLTAIHITTQESILQPTTDDENLSNSIPGFSSLVIIALSIIVVIKQKNQKMGKNH